MDLILSIILFSVIALSGTNKQTINVFPIPFEEIDEDMPLKPTLNKAKLLLLNLEASNNHHFSNSPLCFIRIFQMQYEVFRILCIKNRITRFV